MSARAMWRLAGLPAFACMLVLGGPAAAQYREGQPEVLVPAPQPAVPGDTAATLAFAEAYRKAGRPRIAAFWNRPFGEDLADSRADQLSIRSTRTAGSSSTVVRSEQVVTNADRHPDARDPVLWVLEAEFANPFAAAGAFMVDRAAIMRATHLAAAGKHGNDSRVIEAAALQGKADLLLEVLMTPDAAAPSGFLYRVTVKSVASGEQLLNFVSTGRPAPPAQPDRYVATDRGFAVAPPPPPPGLEQVARHLGIEALKQLTPRLQAVRR